MALGEANHLGMFHSVRYDPDCASAFSIRPVVALQSMQKSIKHKEAAPHNLIGGQAYSKMEKHDKAVQELFWVLVCLG